MKKLLSAALAAVLALSMGVSAMAQSWGSNGTSEVTLPADIGFSDTIYVPGVGTISAGSETKTLNPGDKIYFVLTSAGANYTGDIGSNWSINIDVEKSKTVKNAAFVEDFTGIEPTWAANGLKGVVVTLANDWDDLDAGDVSFTVYVADNKAGVKGAKATVNYKIDNNGWEDVSYTMINNAVNIFKWQNNNDEKGTATFDFGDNVYFTVNMIPDEEVILNLSTAYDKDIDKAYNEYDADLDFYNFKGTNDAFTKAGELFIPSKDDDKFIYEVVDGKLVKVDAKYVEDYNANDGLIDGQDGYVITTDELGYYVVADEKLNASATDNGKDNPGTGANDFVGVATALAVVSVVAAGAVAMKRR